MARARPPARVLVASALCASALLSVAACSGGGHHKASAAAASPAVEQTSAAPAPSTSAAPMLTEAQARAALISDADLGEPWTPTQGAATWRDGLLKATTEKPECGRLLDALYTEELFGASVATRAVVGLDDGYDEAQLRYQVTAHRPHEADKTLAWLKTLPRRCGQFTAATANGAVLGAQVTDAWLPAVGDARQGLRVTLDGETADGEPQTLTLDVAAVRVGDDAISLTYGGLGEVPADWTRQATELGAQRLAEVQKQSRVQA